MAVDVVTEVVIERPLGEVAAYAGDPSSAPEWYVNIDSVAWETPPSWLPWVWSNGGDMLDADGKTCLLDKPEAVEAFTWIQDRAVKDKVIPSPAELTEMNANDMFTSGRLATSFGPRGSLGAFRNIKAFTFDAAPLIKAKKRVSLMGVGWTSI